MRHLQEKPSKYWRDRASIMEGLAAYCLKKGDDKGHLKYSFRAMACLSKASLALMP